MPWSFETLTRSDGARLRLYSSLPAAEPKAIIAINHGMAEHAARYERFAEALVAAGYGVYAHDHRGHGHSEAPKSALGHFGPGRVWGRVIRDTGAVVKLIRERHPGVPVVSFGHSMGAIIAFNYALRHDRFIDGVAIWNSGVDTGALAWVFNAVLKFQRAFKGSDVPSPLAQKATFETWNKEFAPNRTEYDWLSRDEAEVDKYVADPLCGFPVTVNTWLAVLTGIRIASRDHVLKHMRPELPVHLLAGAEDPCTDKSEAVRRIYKRMKAAGMTDVTLVRLEDTRHESLNEINRDEVTAGFIDWLDGRFSVPA